MAADDQNNFQQALYIGNIINALGLIYVGNDKQPRSISLQGQVLFSGYIDKGAFVVKGLNRLAIYGALLRPGPRDRIGLLSLAGPLEAINLKPGSMDVRLALHYRRLSRPELRRYQGQDTESLQVEQVTANLTWRQQQIMPDESAVSLEINLDAIVPVYKRGAVQRVRLELINPPLSFQRAGTAKSRPAPHNSLPSHCDPPPILPPCPNPNQEVNEYRLPMKFVSFSRQDLNTVEGICRGYIERVCEVWRNKAVLDLVVWPNEIDNPGVVEARIAEGTPAEKDEYSIIKRRQEDELLQTNHSSVNHVEVYLVDQVWRDHNGGFTKDGGFPSACCALEVNKVQENPYLLAHELGHILGLKHPDEQPCPGSAGSVMEPVNPEHSHSPINTPQNYSIFTNQCGVILNPIVRNAGVPGCLNLDP